MKYRLILLVLARGAARSPLASPPASPIASPPALAHARARASARCSARSAAALGVRGGMMMSSPEEPLESAKYGVRAMAVGAVASAQRVLRLDVPGGLSPGSPFAIKQRDRILSTLFAARAGAHVFAHGWAKYDPLLAPVGPGGWSAYSCLHAAARWQLVGAFVDWVARSSARTPERSFVYGLVALCGAFDARRDHEAGEKNWRLPVRVWKPVPDSDAEVLADADAERARQRRNFVRRRELREELLERVKAGDLDSDAQQRLSAEMAQVGLRKEAKFVRNARVRRASAPAMSALTPAQLAEKAEEEAKWRRVQEQVEGSRLRRVADRVCNTKHAALTRARLLQELDMLLSVECLLSAGFRYASTPQLYVPLPQVMFYTAPLGWLACSTVDQLVGRKGPIYGAARVLTAPLRTAARVGSGRAFDWDKMPWWFHLDLGLFTLEYWKRFVPAENMPGASLWMEENIGKRAELGK